MVWTLSCACDIMYHRVLDQQENLIDSGSSIHASLASTWIILEEACTSKYEFEYIIFIFRAIQLI